MMLGNMRALGVQRLIASCLNRCLPRINRRVALSGGNRCKPAFEYRRGLQHSEETSNMSRKMAGSSSPP